MEVRDSFAHAADGFVQLVERLSGDRWESPGLGVWDLRALVGHASRSLITVDSYLDKPASEISLASPEAYYAATAALAAADPAAVEERGRQAGAALGDDPAGAVRALRERVVARVRNADDPAIETIAGGMRLSAYLPTRTLELVVHSYDIATAVGLALPEFDTDVLGEVASLAARVAVQRGQAYEVIAALTGRRALPPGFSVV